MTQMISLGRALRFRAHAGFVLACAGLSACDSTDPPTNISDSPTAVAQDYLTPVAPSSSFSSSFRGGIPFGTTGQPTSEFGEVFNGGHRNIGPSELLSELAAIKARGGRIILPLAGHEDNYQDRDSHFSLSMWKARIDRYRGINFNSYIEDGTVLAHWMIDEPNDLHNWNNEPIPGTMLDEMAAYSKSIWPKMATVVRVEPGYLNKWSYRYLDAAWAQWVTRKGDPGAYIRTQVDIARKLGLTLVTGVNFRKGGLKQTELSVDMLRSAGSALLNDDYPCAFISWEYDAKYLARAEARDAMRFLSEKAANRTTKSCLSKSQGGPPPPPPPPSNQLPTAAFTPPSCTAGAACQFEDQSSDTDGTIASWRWDFGDGTTSTEAEPSHTFAAANTYSVTLTVTDDDGGTASVSLSLTVTAAPNLPPSAAFNPPSCTVGVPCQFNDGSSDSDGSVVSRSWSFGEGATSSETNPVHTFAAPGSYSVVLNITDDAGGAGSISHNVTVTPATLPGGQPIALNARTLVHGGLQRVRLTWTGANGATVDIYRNGVRRQPIKNDGVYFRARPSITGGSERYRICEAGSTRCSEEVTVTLRSSSPSITLQVSGRVRNNRDQATLRWSGATGGTVQVYRNGSFIRSTRNDGFYVDARRREGGPTATYRVCLAGTSTCSNNARVTFR